jgi:hypothetical protein
MMINKKLILGGVAAVAALAVVSASRLSRLAKEFVIEFTMRVKASISPISVQILCDILFKNPTDARITVKHPTVSLFESEGALKSNTPITTSEITGKSYVVERNSQKKFDPVTFHIGINQAILAFRLARTYLSGEPITLYVRAITTVNGAAPVEQVQKVELVRAKTDGMGDIIPPTINRFTNISVRQLRPKLASL